MQQHALSAQKRPVRAAGLLLMALASAALLTSPTVLANQNGDAVTVNFHGTLKRKPCHIANDTDISVHFGNVGIKKVDGQRYMQEVPYTIQCEETDPSWTLMLSVKGTQAGFENSALRTNANGLGIRILADGRPMEINKAMAISYTNPPKLQAVPVQQSGVTLPEQEFSATATLMAEYQ
ncbi:TPA: fimbrial protein [Klebsiella aerogenes]|nr:fimbrial protein [Klebsiella aerogenes]